MTRRRLGPGASLVADGAPAGLPAVPKSRGTPILIGVGFVTLFACLLAFGRIAEGSIARRRSRSTRS